MKNRYFQYLKYVLEHKKNVFLECRKVKGMFWYGVFHDMSKLLPCEFIPYADYFYGPYGVEVEKSYSDSENYTNGDSCLSRSYLECKNKFVVAVDHHYKHNKHHWNHWRGKDMPAKYIEQMILDWKGMSRKFGDTPQAYYLKNYNMNLSFYTRMYVEMALNLNFRYGHTMGQVAKMYDRETYDVYFGWIKDEYGIDSYELLK